MRRMTVTVGALPLFVPFFFFPTGRMAKSMMQKEEITLEGRDITVSARPIGFCTQRRGGGGEYHYVPLFHLTHSFFSRAVPFLFDRQRQTCTSDGKQNTAGVFLAGERG